MRGSASHSSGPFDTQRTVDLPAGSTVPCTHVPEERHRYQYTIENRDPQEQAVFSCRTNAYGWRLVLEKSRLALIREAGNPVLAEPSFSILNRTCTWSLPPTYPLKITSEPANGRSQISAIGSESERFAPGKGNRLEVLAFDGNGGHSRWGGPSFPERKQARGGYD